jgi:hypothetical protein
MLDEEQLRVRCIRFVRNERSGFMKGNCCEMNDLMSEIVKNGGLQPRNLVSYALRFGGCDNLH